MKFVDYAEDDQKRRYAIAASDLYAFEEPPCYAERRELLTRHVVADYAVAAA